MINVMTMMVVTALSTVSIMGASSAAHAAPNVDAGAVLDVIAERASSIPDYYITGEHCLLMLPAGQLSSANRFIAELTRHEMAWGGSPLSEIKDGIDQAMRLSQITTEKAPWGTFSTAVAESKMRQDKSWPGGLNTLVYLAPDICLRAAPSSRQRQVDVWSDADSGAGYGIRLDTFLSAAVPIDVRGQPEVIRSDDDGYLVSYVTDSGTKGVASLDKRLVVRNRTTQAHENRVVEEWYMSLVDVDQYVIPRLAVTIHPQAEALVLSVFVIDSIILGSPGALPHAVAPQIPSSSFFVDHRVDPVEVYVFPESEAGHYGKQAPADVLFNSVYEYSNEQKRLMETPVQPAVEPFPVNRSRGIGGLFWVALGGIFVISASFLGYRIFMRRAA